MFSKADMRALLAGARDVPPICIPSYKRWDRDENKSMVKIIEPCDEEILRNTYMFVRAEQLPAYRESFPGANLVKLPKVNGLAATRQYITDFVLDDLRKPHYMDMDDDITSLKAVWMSGGKPSLSKTGEATTAEIIRLGYEIAKAAFEINRCLLGNFRRVHFANQPEYTQTAYFTNKGATPRSVMFINAALLRRMGIRRNLMFDPTGDDVGFVAEIGKARGNMFNIPCLAYSFVDDAINSVVRNESNIRQLAQYEHSCIKKYPMRNYMRTPFTFEDGSYKFCDIDFTKYRKATGNKSYALSLEKFAAMQRKLHGTEGMKK